nr:immunoglobulin heavy chain junction region [Macaca mulatta]MOV88792.1 immunoglobulin heavy chain junction region [Macaca mulatta]
CARGGRSFDWVLSRSEGFFDLW